MDVDHCSATRRSPLSTLANDQVLDVIQYLNVDDFKSLRLAGGKSMCLSDPRLTSHLPLRMDRAGFFGENELQFPEDFVRRWLENRRRLVVNDAQAKLSPARVAYLVDNGYLDSVQEIVVHDCRRHRRIVELLARAPNVSSLTLVDQSDEREAVGDLEAILSQVGMHMHSLTSLDIEFISVVHGSRLSFLTGLYRIKHLRLVGFDLSEGIGFLGRLTSVETLHLCHGNYFSSPDQDVNEKEMTGLASLTNLKQVHLEGFDGLAGVGLGPFGAHGSLQHFVMKHCQESAGDECLAALARMTHLKSLHYVLGSCDDTDTFDEERIQQLNALNELESLSLFYVLEDANDIRSLPGLTALQTLNVAFDDALDDEEAENLCTIALQTFPSLQKIRVFSEDGMERQVHYGGLDLEFAEFSLGDTLCLD
ncbi:hypothetical protein ACHAXT_012580 [Thalassiosira profunda]